MYKSLWKKIKDILPDGRSDVSGSITIPSPGLYDWEEIEHGGEVILTFTVRTCKAYPIWKIRRYLDYLLASEGGFLNYKIYIYSEDAPPCRRGRKREDFQHIDLTVFIS